MVNRLSVFYSVHFEEVPFEQIRDAIIDAISELRLLNKPPTVLDFACIWNAEVSVLVRSGKRVARKDKSLRSLVISLFHDRRGKIAALARTHWNAVFTPTLISTTQATGGPDAVNVGSTTGVHSLTASSGDCWGMIRPQSGSSVFLVVKRKYVDDNHVTDDNLSVTALAESQPHSSEHPTSNGQPREPQTAPAEDVLAGKTSSLDHFTAVYTHRRRRAADCSQILSRTNLSAWLLHRSYR